MISLYGHGEMTSRDVNCLKKKKTKYHTLNYYMLCVYFTYFGLNEREKNKNHIIITPIMYFHHVKVH